MKFKVIASIIIIVITLLAILIGASIRNGAQTDSEGQVIEQTQ